MKKSEACDTRRCRHSSSPGIHQLGGETRQSRGAETSQADHEEIRPTAEDRHRQASGLFRGDERHRCCSRAAPGRRSAQQSRREFASAVSATRTGDAAAFEVRRHCRSSAQFMPRYTTNSIRSAISSRGKSTSRDVLLPWPSGAPLRHKSPLPRWRSLHVDKPPLV